MEVQASACTRWQPRRSYHSSNGARKTKRRNTLTGFKLNLSTHPSVAAYSSALWHAQTANGMMLPSRFAKKKSTNIKTCFKGNITIMDTKKTAYGNLVLANDNGAVVDPRFKEKEIKQISEALGVEAGSKRNRPVSLRRRLGSGHQQRRAWRTRCLTDEEKKTLETVFKVPVDVGTVNCGIPYVGTGLIANSHAAVAGSMTTGPEMFIIGNALDVVQEDKNQ